MFVCPLEHSILSDLMKLSLLTSCLVGSIKILRCLIVCQSVCLSGTRLLRSLNLYLSASDLQALGSLSLSLSFSLRTLTILNPKYFILSTLTINHLGCGHDLPPQLTEEGRGEGEGVEQGVLVHRLGDNI